MFILLSILVEFIFISILILLLYRLKPRFGLIPLYVFIGAIQYFQTILKTVFTFEIFGGISIHAGSTILFAASLFAILLIYIKEGVRLTQRFIVSIILSNLAITILSLFANQQELAISGIENKLFTVNYRVFIVGTIVLILDAFILVIIYEFLFTKIRWLNLYGRLIISLLVILNFDALFFVSGVFWNDPSLSKIISDQMIGKSGAALFYGTVLFIYLRYLDTINEQETGKRGNEDIFSIITYQGKYEKLKSEKVISEEQLRGIIKEKTTEQDKALRRYSIMASVRELRIDKFSTSDQAKEFLIKVQESFEVDACTIHLIKNEELEMLASIGITENGKEYKLKLTSPYLEEMIRKKQSLFVEDARKDSRFHPNIEPGGNNFSFISCAGAPLINSDKVIGLLKIYSVKSIRMFSNLELEHLQLVASQVAHNIEVGQLFEQNEKHKEVLVKQIIARKKVEEAIKESEEKYRNLVEQASDGIMIISDGSLALLEVNNMICKMLGYSKEELLKLSIFDIAVTQPSDAETRYKELQNRRSLLQERIFNRKDGTKFSGEVSTVVMQNGNYLSFVRDITERKKSEEERQLLLMRNQQTIDSMLDGYILADLNGKIIDANPAYCNMSGYSREELLGSSAHELDANLAEGEIKNLITDAVKNTSLYVETRHWRKDKTIIDVEVSVSAVYFEEETFLASFLKDITERKKVEEHIKVTNEQLRQLTGHLQTIREEERSRIGQEIHDQLGQHLTVLKMDVSRLKKNIPVGKNKEQDLEEIMSELDNCLQMVRKISSDLRPSMIEDLGLIAALEWQTEEFEKRTEIITRFSSNIIDLKLPHSHSIGLFRIFQESLTNVARHAEAKKIFAELNLEDGIVFLTITDDGKGFDTESVGGKRSLGLLGMRERTILMNGKYEIISELGKGTIVKVTVPL